MGRPQLVSSFENNKAYDDSPSGFHIDEHTGNIYIADSYNHRVRMITASDGFIQTVAGSGKAGFSGDGYQATDASLARPSTVRFVNGQIYIVDYGNARIRKVDADGIITTMVGNGYTVAMKTNSTSPLDTSISIGSSSSAFHVYENGDLLFIDRNVNLKKVSNGVISSVFATNGKAMSSLLVKDKSIYYTYYTYNNSIYMVTGLNTSELVQTVISYTNSLVYGEKGFMVSTPVNGIWALNETNGLNQVIPSKPTKTFNDSLPIHTSLSEISSLVMHNGNFYFMDSVGLSVISNGMIKTLFTKPAGEDTWTNLAFDSKTGYFYFNSGLKVMRWKEGVSVETVAGNGRLDIQPDGPAVNSSIQPSCLSTYNGEVYICDEITATIRKVTTSGDVVTVVGVLPPPRQVPDYPDYPIPEVPVIALPMFSRRSVAKSNGLSLPYYPNSVAAVNVTNFFATSLTFNAKGEMYIGYYGGVAVVKDGMISRLPFVVGGPNSLSIDTNGTIYASTFGSMYVLKGNTTLRMSSLGFGSSDKIADNVPLSSINIGSSNILITPDNVLYFTTDGSIHKMDLAGGSTPVFELKCYGLNTTVACSGHGTCIKKDTCYCNAGYTGNECEMISCFGKNGTSNCKGNGQCIGPDQCKCNAGFIGIECEQTVSTCFGTEATSAQVCSGRGVCISKDTCSCSYGYSGNQCQDKIPTILCFGIKANTSTVCGGHGDCSETNVCHCRDGYSGKDCTSFSCLNNCNGHGECKAPNVCSCQQKYSGSDCSQFIQNDECVLPPSNSLKFCKDAVNYNILNTIFTNGAKNETDAQRLMKQGLTSTDLQAESEYNSQLKSMSNCDSTCQVALTRKVCYEKFLLCTAKKTQSALCQSTCLEIIKSTNQPDSGCSSLADTDCNYGAYLPANTICYGTKYSEQGVCSGNGKCIGMNSCSCSKGYTGDNCQYPICFSKPSNDATVCNGKGKCTTPDTCSDCKDGMTGQTCSEFTCNRKSESKGGCSFRGKCAAVDTCTCEGNFDPKSFCSKCLDGYIGEKCDQAVCFGVSSVDSLVCSGNGKCILPNTCECKDGFIGKTCASFSCGGIDKKDSSSVCSGRGECTKPNTCKCSANYGGSTCNECLPSFTGTDCLTPTCSESLTCNNNGKCGSDNKCVCNGNFVGAFCKECASGFVGTKCDVKCSRESTCSSHGSCNQDGTCSCDGNFEGSNCNSCKSGWYGDDCTFKIVSDSFEFNVKGDAIVGTVYSSIKKQVTCDFFMNQESMKQIGTTASCKLDQSILTIMLSPLATIVPGETLKFYSNPFKPIETISITIKTGSFVPVNPNAGFGFGL